MNAALINVGRNQVTLRADRQVRINGNAAFQEHGDSLDSTITRALNEADRMHKQHGMHGGVLNFRAHIVAAFLVGQYVGNTMVDISENWGVQL